MLERTDRWSTVFRGRQGIYYSENSNPYSSLSKKEYGWDPRVVSLLVEEPTRWFCPEPGWEDFENCRGLNKDPFLRIKKDVELPTVQLEKAEVEDKKEEKGEEIKFQPFQLQNLVQQWRKQQR